MNRRYFPPSSSLSFTKTKPRARSPDTVVGSARAVAGALPPWLTWTG